MQLGVPLLTRLAQKTNQADGYDQPGWFGLKQPQSTAIRG